MSFSRAPQPPRSARSATTLLREWALPLFVFTLPFGKISVTAALLVLVLSEWLNRSAGGGRRGAIALFLLPVGYFALHLIGLLYSSNLAFGFFDVQVKAGLVVLPFCLYFHGALRQEEWRRILIAYFAGLATALAACFLGGMRTLVQAGSVHDLFYTSFSFYLHPSYFAWYLNTAVLLLWFPVSPVPRFGKWWFALQAFFSVGVFLLSSKAGFAGWSGIVVLGGISAWAGTRSWRAVGIALSMLLVFGLALWKIVPPEEDRVRAMQESLSQDSIAASDPHSSNVRLHVWSAAWSLIREQPLWGTGTGDVKDFLLRRYEERGLTPAVKKKLNAHNQFLQSWLALGLLPVLLLAAHFVLPAFRFRRDAVFLGWLGLSAFNFLVESMLETQSGIVFWAFFYSLFLSRNSVLSLNEDH